MKRSAHVWAIDLEMPPRREEVHLLGAAEDDEEECGDVDADADDDDVVVTAEYDVDEDEVDEDDDDEATRGEAELLDSTDLDDAPCAGLT